MSSRQRVSERPHGIRRADAVAHPVRVHDRLPHHLPGLHHRPGELARAARVRVAAHRRRALQEPVQVLGEGVRGLLRPRRRVRDRDELPARHQLVALLRVRRQRHRAGDRLRGHHRLLPGGGLPRHHAVRLGQGRRPAALPLHLPRRARHADLRLLDPVRQFLDADPRRLPHRERHRGPGRLVEDRLQPLLPVALRPHGAGLLPHHGLRGRGHVGLDAAAPPPRRAGGQARRRPALAVDGDVVRRRSSRRSSSSSATCTGSAS